MWHDVGTSMALKKAAKILSERSSEFRTPSSSRKRKAEPTSEAPPQQKLAEMGQIQASYADTGGSLMAQQPMQPMQPNLASTAVGYQGAFNMDYQAGLSAAAEHLRQGADTGGSPLGLSGDSQRQLMQGSHLMVGDADSLTPGIRRRGEGLASSTSDVDDESPESIVQDSPAIGEGLPSAASLSGVFTSSSSDAHAKDSSPSTDES